MRQITLEYMPQPRQRLMHESCARQIFYGGAAGGGKSHALRWDAINFCLNNPGLQAYIFRRTLPELEDNHIKQIKAEIPPEIGVWAEAKKRMEFYNGSCIVFCYCEKENDVYRYLGGEHHWTGLDEASRMLEGHIALLRTRNRLGGYKPSVAYQHALPRFIMASNPGGPAHNFLKSTFIDQAPPETLFYDRIMRDPANPEDKGWLSIFIPAKMRDNAYIDKDYESSFSGLAPELARAYRDGDWDAVVGQALHSLSRDRHMLRVFMVPKHWTKFMSIDWGSAKPFSVGWYAVSDGATLRGKDGARDIYLQPGALIRYAEWYGWNGKADGGARLDSQHVAREIIAKENERNEVMDYRVGDTSMWNRLDGPSVAERMMSTDPRFKLKQVARNREHGYAEFISRLAGATENKTITSESDASPMLYITENCRHFWRTVPPLTLDENNPEKGPDTKLEDHVYDEVVYALLSRPYQRTEYQRWEEENFDEIERIKGGDPYAIR